METKPANNLSPLEEIRKSIQIKIEVSDSIGSQDKIDWELIEQSAAEISKEQDKDDDSTNAS